MIPQLAIGRIIDATPPNWIPVDHILPEIGQPVQALRDGVSAPVNASRYGRENNRYLDEDNGRYVYDVTHWRPRTSAGAS